MSESFFGMTISSCDEILSISSYILSALLKKFGSLELLETQIIKISKSISDFNNLGMSVCPCDVSLVTSSPSITLCTRSLCKSATNI